MGQAQSAHYRRGETGPRAPRRPRAHMAQPPTRQETPCAFLVVDVEVCSSLVPPRKPDPLGTEHRLAGHYPCRTKSAPECGQHGTPMSLPSYCVRIPHLLIILGFTLDDAQKSNKPARRAGLSSDTSWNGFPSSICFYASTARKRREVSILRSPVRRLSEACVRPIATLGKSGC